MAPDHPEGQEETLGNFLLFPSKRARLGGDSAAPANGGSGGQGNGSSNSSGNKKEERTEPEPIGKGSATFEQLGLDPWLVVACRSVALLTPTEVQANCIPPILAGRDTIGSAKTGSGKTAAFALPILQQLAADPYGVFALVLTPTRELAFQIAEQFRVLGTGVDLRQAVIVGGMDMTAQALQFAARPHVIVATPGRLLDHLRSNAFGPLFKRLRFLVLDEVDRLLEETFSEALLDILAELPSTRQNLLFTATMTPEIEAMATPPAGGSSRPPPFIYQCATRYETVDLLDQRYLFIPSTVRDAYLVHLLRTQLADKSIIIFAASCRSCELLRVMLRELGIRSTALHAQMSQNDRLGSMAKFKSNIVPILIATDVGSRGLDIPLVQVVINYVLPADAMDYIHRIGRTARAGRGGMAISLVTEGDVDILHHIEARTGKRMGLLEVEEAEVLDCLTEVGGAKRVANLALLDGNFGDKARRNRAKQRTAVGVDGQPGSGKRKDGGSGHRSGKREVSSGKRAAAASAP